MPNGTTTKTKVATQTKVIIAVGALLLLGLAAYGFGFIPGVRRAADPRLVTCGNGKLDVREVCDDGRRNGQSGYCNATCSGQVKVKEEAKKVVNEAAAPAPVPGELIVNVAEDSPSGTTSGSSEQTIGKYILWNTATSSIASIVRGGKLTIEADFRHETETTAASPVRLYKTSVTGENLLASSRVWLSSTSTTRGEIYFTDGTFDINIPGGTTVPIIVTVDTSSATTDNSIWMTLNYLRWKDGVSDVTNKKNFNLTAPTLNY